MGIFDRAVEVDYAAERRLRARKTGLIVLGALSPFLFAGGYVGLILAAQSAEPKEPLYADAAQLQSVRWTDTMEDQLEVKARLYRKDGKKNVTFPQRAQLIDVKSGLPLPGAAEQNWVVTPSYADVTYSQIVKAPPPLVKLTVSNRIQPPPDPFALLRELPGMAPASIGFHHDFIAVPQLQIPPRPQGSGKVARDAR